jgi:hypothetical protein
MRLFETLKLVLRERLSRSGVADHMMNVEAIELTNLKSNFFAIMEEICVPDMDKAALAQYRQQHEDDEESLEDEV